MEHTSPWSMLTMLIFVIRRKHKHHKQEHRIKRIVFMDFIHRLVSQEQKN
jgi:hypothetical protein